MKEDRSVESSRMNTMLMLALHTAETGEWYERNAPDFRSDEEFETYVLTAYEVIKFNEENPGEEGGLDCSL